MKGEQYHVMVVDDDPVVSESLAAYLEDYDFIVTRKMDGEAALECASSRFFSAAVIDLRLPGMTGEALIEKFAELSPETCFIIYTGLIDYLPPEKLKRAGIGPDNIFCKPISDLDILVKKVNDMISAKRYQVL